jgi:hypothetical protein
MIDAHLQKFDVMSFMSLVVKESRKGVGAISFASVPLLYAYSYAKVLHHHMIWCGGGMQPIYRREEEPGKLPLLGQ